MRSEMTHNLPWVEKLTAFSFNWTESSLSQFLRDNSHARILLSSEIEPQAFILWLELGSTAEVMALATNPESQGRGIMRKVWTRWVNDLKLRGVKEIILEVHADNHLAFCFYKNLGLCVVGKRKSYYRDGAEALVLKTILVP